MRMNRIKTALCAFTAALLFAACSNMMEELKPKASAPSGGLPALSIKDGPNFSDGLVTIVVNGDVPDSPKPKMTYKLPDGKTVALEGTVVKNSDGTSTITYDMNPVPKDLTDGKIEVTLEAKGYAPTKAKVDYVAPKPLEVTASQMKNPDGIVSITIKDDIPASPAPTVTYLLPDGTPIEVEGTVAQNPDGTKTLTFDLNPIPQELQGGTLPLTVTVPGYHLPTDVTVDYIPPAQVEISVGGKSADFTMFNSEAEDLEPPKITTNYHDNLDMETTYTANPGATVLDGWEAVKEWLADPANDGKTLTISAAATPKPDTDPTSAASTTLVITCKKDSQITSAVAGPDEPSVGEEVEAKAYAGSVEYTGKTFVWQWYAAENSTDDGDPIEDAENGKYTVGDGLYGKFIYAVATQTLPGVSPIVMPTNRLEVKPSASMDIDVTAYSFTMAVADLGQNKFKFTVTTDLPSPAFIWLVDAQKQAGQTASDFTLDMGAQSYLFGWHDVEVLCVKNSTPYSARASVKKKQAQAAPTVESGGVTKESEWKAADGKIQIAAPYDRAQYSIDGGSSWIDVGEDGLAIGLSVGEDWTSDLSALIRYKGDDERAASAATTVPLGIEKYTVAHGASNGSIVITPAGSPANSIPAGVPVSLTATASQYYTLDPSSIKAVKTETSDPIALDGEGSTRTFTMPKSNVTLSATFNKMTYTLTINSMTNGKVTADKSSPVAWDTTVTLTVTPNANKRLKDGTLKVNNGSVTVTQVTAGKKYTFKMPKANAAVTATFEDACESGEYTPLPAGTDGTAGKNATYAKFGLWPQTIKKSNVTITSTKKTVGMFTCEKGSDGEWYVKLENVVDRSGEGKKWSDGTSMTGGTKYFKMEPIKWRVLSTTSGAKFLLSEVALDVNFCFYDGDMLQTRNIDGKDVYPFNYEHSRLRAFLNGISYQIKASETAAQAACDEFKGKGFLYSAFTGEERDKILTTTVDNSWQNAQLSSSDTSNAVQEFQKERVARNTSDKIFALSSKEFYDYVGTASSTVTSRIRYATDYAYGRGCSWFDGISYPLRSPSLYDPRRSRECVITTTGNNTVMLSTTFVSTSYCGIVPALRVTSN